MRKRKTQWKRRERRRIEIQSEEHLGISRREFITETALLADASA